MPGQISLVRPTFMIFDENANGPPIGTGFSINRPELVLTADHVVQGRRQVHVVNTGGPELEIIRSSFLVTHPTADIAAVILPIGSRRDADHFELGIPLMGMTTFPLETR